MAANRSPTPRAPDHGRYFKDAALRPWHGRGDHQEFHLVRCKFYVSASCIGHAVVTAAVALESPLGHRTPKWLLKVGDASYSIYLVHMATALAVFQAWRKVTALHNPAGTAATMIVATLASVGAGVLVYWFVERPIIKHFKVPTPESRPLVAGSSNS